MQTSWVGRSTKSLLDGLDKYSNMNIEPKVPGRSVKTSIKNQLWRKRHNLTCRNTIFTKKELLHFHFYSNQKWKKCKPWPSTFQRQIALYSPGWSVSPLILPPQNLTVTERSETKLIMIYEYMLGKRTPSAVIPRQSYTKICNFLTKMLPIKFYHKNFPPKQFHRKYPPNFFHR